MTNLKLNSAFDRNKNFFCRTTVEYLDGRVEVYGDNIVPNDYPTQTVLSVEIGGKEVSVVVERKYRSTGSPPFEMTLREVA